MDTLRVDLSYRPLRIGWAISAGDIDAFRKAARLSHAFWGGRFNPMLVVDHPQEAQRLVDLFRLDLIWPVSDTKEVHQFIDKFPYILDPLIHKTLFVGGSRGRKHPLILDVHNALVQMRDKPEWISLKSQGVRLYSWATDDPLRDVFLIQLGEYPDVQITGIDYRAMYADIAEVTEHQIHPHAVLPGSIAQHPSIAYLSRIGMRPHYSIQSGRQYPGFFVGAADDLGDLVCHWNLRACDVPLWFIDPAHLPRYKDLIPVWDKAMRDLVANRDEWERHIAVWTRRADLDAARAPFGDGPVMLSHVSEFLWNGRNVRSPLMTFGEASVLGVLGNEGNKPRISFSLAEKPFAGDTWFHQQHLVVSVGFIGDLYGDDYHTLRPPYLPELNEFYSRTMHIDYSKLRIEPGRIGLVISASDTDTFLYALPVAELVERIFSLAGYRTKLSEGGLILRQLIKQLGGLQGGRAFKISGVRTLLKTHGPTKAFKKRPAIAFIRGQDFKDHEDLHIGPRPRGTKLTPEMVFSKLVERGLYRIGSELDCPRCRMTSWVALDILKQHVVCELCGNEYDATRQLVEGEWHYRRSGILGRERHAQGAIPVARTLQQLDTSLGGDHGVYSPSLELKCIGNGDQQQCEIDFVWIIPSLYDGRTSIILGECKDEWPIDAADIENLRRVADALPAHRFDTYVLLSKISGFTTEEIEHARTLNGKYHRRAILLTARELEPYLIYERTKGELGIGGYGGTPADMAKMTEHIYFNKQEV